MPDISGALAASPGRLTNIPFVGEMSPRLAAISR